MSASDKSTKTCGGSLHQSKPAGCCAPAAGEWERREEAAEGPDRRLNRVERRVGIDRRKQTREATGYDGPERRWGERRTDTGLERRRGPGRRLSDVRKSAEEGEMTPEQFEFVMAVETYKKVNKRLYPSWTEILEIINQLGYRKIGRRDFDLANVPEPELYDKAG